MEPPMQHTVDVTGLSPEAVRAVEAFVAALREGQRPTPDLDEWSMKLRSWAAGHRLLRAPADDSREGIYAGRGE
jgi:hypothetical protein